VDQMPGQRSSDVASSDDRGCHGDSSLLLDSATNEPLPTSIPTATPAGLEPSTRSLRCAAEPLPRVARSDGLIGAASIATASWPGARIVRLDLGELDDVGGEPKLES